MKKKQQKLNGKSKGKDVTGSLKTKAAVCSAEAAVVSIIIHVLIIAFAGSLVAYEYIKRKDAAFEGQNVNRPKLERRQLQMPVKVKNLQKKSRRPKVKSRMTSASKSALALPEMSALGMGMGKDGDAFGAAGGLGSGTTDLSSMGAAGSLGFGISKVNFFGAKSKGEKIVFIVDASAAMMLDSKGGYYTYKFAKDRIREMIDKMKSATLFNVIFYGIGSAAPFSPQLLPATAENKEALKAWLEPMNSDPKKIGVPKEMPTYSSEIEYETEIGLGAKDWARAAQSAMEQKADNIFILTAGWGFHAYWKGLSKKEMADWLDDHGWPKKRVDEYKKLIDVRKEMAKKLFAKENKARAKKGLPPRILKSGGLSGYGYMNEVKSQLPPSPSPKPPKPKLEQERAYTYDDVIEHLNGVYKYNYIPEKLKKPQIHFVQLIASDEEETMTEVVKKMKKVTRAFKGDFDYLRGAKTMESLLKFNNVSDEE